MSNNNEISRKLINALVKKLKENPTLFIEDVIAEAGLYGNAKYEMEEILGELA